jgi:hypothetical protein
LRAVQPSQVAKKDAYLRPYRFFSFLSLGLVENTDLTRAF